MKSPKSNFLHPKKKREQKSLHYIFLERGWKKRLSFLHPPLKTTTTTSSTTSSFVWWNGRRALICANNFSSCCFKSNLMMMVIFCRLKFVEPERKGTFRAAEWMRRLESFCHQPQAWLSKEIRTKKVSTPILKPLPICCSPSQKQHARACCQNCSSCRSLEFLLWYACLNEAKRSGVNSRSNNRACAQCGRSKRDVWKKYRPRF